MVASDVAQVTKVIRFTDSASVCLQNWALETQEPVLHQLHLRLQRRVSYCQIRMDVCHQKGIWADAVLYLEIGNT